MPVPYWGPYATSKAALDMLVRTYAAEIARTPVRVNLIDPGVVRTAMRAQAFPGENPDELAAARKRHRLSSSNWPRPRTRATARRVRTY